MLILEQVLPKFLVLANPMLNFPGLLLKTTFFLVDFKDLQCPDIKMWCFVSEIEFKLANPGFSYLIEAQR